MRDYFPIRDSKRLECKKVLLKEEILLHYQNCRFYLRKCLVSCMFELMNLYYTSLILIILPLRCFIFKIFPCSPEL